LLQRATEQLPEVSEYWLALAIQYRRCKKTEAAAQAALNAYLGNWAFGVPDNKVIHLLSQAADVPNFQDDPVIQCIKEQGLDLSFGGTKENNNYPLMQMCVDTYFAQRKPLQALTLLHNYAWIMSSETTAFQERYDFNIDEWRAKFRQLCLEYFGDSRTQFT
ncbi:TPA: tetratricopeptide repeat protein YfbP, partial [Escherichia coli]